MPDWLIGLSVAFAASSPPSAAGPTWTDKVQAFAAVLAALGVIGGFIFSGYQIREGRKAQAKAVEEQARAVQLQIAQRALRLMQLLIQITRIMVERPYLAPYIYDGKDVPKKGWHPKRRHLHDEVLAYGRLFMSFGEAVGWQIEAHQMGDSEGAAAWRDYFTDLYDHSPAVQRAIAQHGWLLADQTRCLFGLGPSK